MFLGKENVQGINTFATNISNIARNYFFWYKTENCHPKEKYSKNDCRMGMPEI